MNFEKKTPNGLRYRRLVENQARKRNPVEVQKHAKKRAAYQPSGARCVGRWLKQRKIICRIGCGFILTNKRSNSNSATQVDILQAIFTNAIRHVGRICIRARPFIALGT
jgi:hypothetical protein